MTVTRYRLEHHRGTVDITLSNALLVVRSQGNALLDKPKAVEVPLTDIRHFCVVPVIRAQQIISRRNPDDSGFLYDESFDSELIVSFQREGKLLKRRYFVSQSDPDLLELLSELTDARPDASLAGLEPREALRRIGVMSARTVVWIIVGALVGLPVLVTLGALTYFIATGFK
ncbi:MAG: hypothetical protein RL885_23045 [Planctomycetota bacterium]